MKVTGSGPSSTDRARDVTGAGGATSVGSPKEKRRSGKAGEIESETAEKVAISSKARDTAKAKEVAKSAPDIDEARVAKLKSAIQSGSYDVDADKVADRLVNEHLYNAF